MTPTDIITAVGALERACARRLDGHSFVVCTAWRDNWRLVIHATSGQYDFTAGQPEEAFDAAHKWLEIYKPDEQRLAEILGLHLLEEGA